MPRRFAVISIASAVAVMLVILTLTGRLGAPFDGDAPAQARIALGGGAFLPTSGQAQPEAGPTTVGFQGLLTDPLTGDPIPDATYSIAFRIFDAPTTGSQKWTETQMVAVSGGLFSVALGSVTPFPSDAFGGTPRYLEVQVGADPPMAPRLPFSSVPYAFNANAADSAPWSGLTGVPAGFADGVDNDTTYTAGAGLALSGNQFRVASLPKPGYVDRALVTTGTVGQYPSIIIGYDGLPIISYYDATNGDLEVYHCDDLTCSTGTATVIDSTGVVGKFTSITIGGDGFALISYYDDTNGDLKLARCTNMACTSASATTVDSGGDVGQYTSITTNVSGFGFISYYDVTNGDLKVASCTNAACTTRTIWPVDTGGNVGQYTSIMRNTSDDAYISYYDVTNGNLKVAQCVNLSCASPNLRTLDGTTISNGAEHDVGRFTSITSGADGLPLIAYAKVNQPGFHGPGARVAHCTTSNCAAADVRTWLNLGSEALAFAVSLSPHGLGLMALTTASVSRIYLDACADVACGSGPINDNVVTTNSPQDISMTIGADGLPVIAYYADTGDDLRFLHCSDVTCIRHLRPR